MKANSLRDGPDIARVAALFGDPARANMLVALGDGRALTATELAAEAGVTKQTASSHLSRLTASGLLVVEPQGRHRYYRVTDDEVAHAIESLMGLAQLTTGRRTRTGPRDPELRHARACYNHLAGELGVVMFGALSRMRWLRLDDEGVALTKAGRREFEDFGVDVGGLERMRRPLCRPCLDWSERRHHLAGSLGVALLARFVELKWAKRESGSRIVAFSPRGERALLSWLS